jgi:ATP-dependent DNA ligase
MKRERGGYWADAEDETAIIIREMSRADAESEGLLPVTKPWAMGWIGAIICGCYNKKGKLVKVAEVKGISDQIQEYIKAHKKALINKRVLEIKFQDFISTDPKSPSVRHPRYHRMRDDMTREDCTIEYFLREGD